MHTQRKDGLRREAAALLALGWVPSADEPGRLYPLVADMPPVVVQRFVWEVMLDLVEDRRRGREWEKSSRRIVLPGGHV